MPRSAAALLEDLKAYHLSTPQLNAEDFRWT